MIRSETLEKNKLFLNACIEGIESDNFSVTNTVASFGVSSNLFYQAVLLGFFSRKRAGANKYKYIPTLKSFSDRQVEMITQHAYAMESKAKYKSPEKPIAEMIKKAEKQGMQRLTNHIIATHLSNETDEDLIAELKRRGYSGTIEIKKTVTI